MGPDFHRRASDKCDNYDDCHKDRLAGAEFRGKVLASLDSIGMGVKDLWGAVNTSRDDIKQLYFKVGLISGGTSLVVSLVISLVMNRGG